MTASSMLDAAHSILEAVGTPLQLTAVLRLACLYFFPLDPQQEVKEAETRKEKEGQKDREE